MEHKGASSSLKTIELVSMQRKLPGFSELIQAYRTVLAIPPLLFDGLIGVQDQLTIRNSAEPNNAWQN